MAKRVDPTIRQTAVSDAAKQFQRMTAGYTSLDVEMMGVEVPDEDVLMFKVVVIGDDLVRACVVYDYPGRDRSLYAGIEGDLTSAVKWLKAHGIPAERLRNY